MDADEGVPHPGVRMDDLLAVPPHDLDGRIQEAGDTHDLGHVGIAASLAEVARDPVEGVFGDPTGRAGGGEQERDQVEAEAVGTHEVPGQ